jgi:hypothetical protein
MSPEPMVEQIAPDPAALVPKHLYKYRSLRGRSKAFVRDLLVNQRLYFPTPAELNDPFEFRPVLDLSVTNEQRQQYLRRLVQRLHGEKPRAERRRLEKTLAVAWNGEALAESYRRTMDSVGVFSMSAQPLDLLMWPHYADNHAGICVRLDLWSLVRAECVPMFVTYRRERPVTNPMLDEPTAMLNKAALTKGLPWAYEKEWRLVLNERGGQVVQFEPPIPSGLILGARISPEDGNEVLGWVGECNRPMDVYQACFHEQNYALEARPIDADDPRRIR